MTAGPQCAGAEIAPSRQGVRCPPCGAPSDDDLMRRVQAGDNLAFGELYDRYAQQALRFAQVLCNSRERAEDAVQEAFLSLWCSRDSFDTRHSTESWIYALTRNRSIDMHRHNRRGDRLRASDVHLASLPAPGCLEDDSVRDDEASRLRTSLEHLPMSQREVLELAYFAQLTHAEIAQHLQLPLGTVKGRIRLGLCRARGVVDGSPAIRGCPRGV